MRTTTLTLDDYTAILRDMMQVSRLTFTEIVEKARDADHPLHDYFDWDDAIAGQKHRLEQARQLLYRVKMTVTTRGSLIPATVPVYVRDPDVAGDEQGMIALTDVLNDSTRQQVVLDREFVRLSAWLSRVRGLAIAMERLPEFEALLSRWTVTADKNAA
jgi:hypothetical protein